MDSARYGLHEFQFNEMQQEALDMSLYLYEPQFLICKVGRIHN